MKLLAIGLLSGWAVSSVWLLRRTNAPRANVRGQDHD